MADLKAKKLFLLDMDGTIYIDEDLFDGSKDFLEKVKAKGGRYIFMTNNSSRGVDSYIEKMKRLGIDTTAEDFLTSVDALILFLRERYGDATFEKSIYIMGTESFKKQMMAAGFNILGEEKIKLTKTCDIVIIGFDRELTFEKLEIVSELLRNENIEYFATNPDWVCPVSFGAVPDCGSFAFIIEKATGRKPFFIGKPEAYMAEMAMKKFSASKEETLIVGDRIYTDIACGVNAGIDTAFVLSGEGVPSDIEKYRITPTYTFKNIKDIVTLI